VIVYDLQSQPHRVDLTATSTHEKLEEVYSELGAIPGIDRLRFDFAISAVDDVALEIFVRFGADWDLRSGKLEIKSVSAQDERTPDAASVASVADQYANPSQVQCVSRDSCFGLLLGVALACALLGVLLGSIGSRQLRRYVGR